MKHSITNLDSRTSRRDFLKTMAVTLLGTLAACVPRFLTESQPPPAQSPTYPINPTTIPPTSEASKSVNTPTATATTTPTTTIPPTTCPPDVECDQASLSGSNGNAEISRSINKNILNPGPTYIITSLCLRDGGCVEVCPVECIVPGFPIEEWPRYYIDPYTCIDCGACIPECPYAAIFPEDEVPTQFIAKGGDYINRLGICGHYQGTNHYGETVVLDSVCRLKKGQMVDLTVDIQDNYSFFERGPGYDALNG